MKKAINDVFLMGLGVARLTRKKAEQTMRIFVNRGAISGKEAREVINGMMKEADKVKSRLMKEGTKEAKSLKKGIFRTANKARNDISKGIRGVAHRVVRKGMKI